MRKWQSWAEVCSLSCLPGCLWWFVVSSALSPDFSPAWALAHPSLYLSPTLHIHVSLCSTRLLVPHTWPVRSPSGPLLMLPQYSGLTCPPTSPLPCRFHPLIPDCSYRISSVKHFLLLPSPFPGIPIVLSLCYTVQLFVLSSST